jgi:hypothetical protein
LPYRTDISPSIPVFHVSSSGGIFPLRLSRKTISFPGLP